MMRTKSVPVQIKAAGEHEGTDAGVFEAIVAAYNIDSGGDKITPGAFTKTLAEWTIKGDPLPVIWSHNWGDPDSHIGVVEDAKETDAGLWIKARLDLDEPKAAKVYKLLKGRRVTQFSFGYEVPKGGGEWVEGKSEEEPGYFALNEIKLFEVGPCLVGMNQATSLGTVKTAEAGLSEERVRTIVSELLAAKTTDPAPPEPQTTSDATEWGTITATLTALSDQVKALVDQLAQQPTPDPAPAATDDTPEGKSAAPENPAPDPLRAQLAALNANLADL
ncbi:HK97 family phage prohead protease [Nocardiopsis terrae]|uniref:HK97 family phage prohead protease n=1 Tax=Streptomyces sp. NPDC057554 TaxID=3350538 RepID=UPI0036ADFB24